MQLLRRMAADLLASERQRAERAVRRVVLQALLRFAAVVIALIGAAFLAASLYLYLRGVLGAWQAALATGAIAIAAALVVLAASMGLRSRPAKPASAPSSEQSGAAAGLGRAAAEILSGTNLRTTDAAMVALLAGIALGIGAGRRQRNTSGTGKKGG